MCFIVTLIGRVLVRVVAVGQEEIAFLFGGQATSILSSLEESIGKIDDFLSFERGFMYGDIVCSVTDPSGQMGRLFNINMLINLENSYGDIMKNFNSKKILKIRSISVGDYVVRGACCGEEIEEEVAEIGYKVVGPLQQSDRVFKQYELVFAVVQVGLHQFEVSNIDSIYVEKLKFLQVDFEQGSDHVGFR
ncbi:hypothetical protein QYF36_006083 [Acer negundo]|nr:hypothetical protein QYF36_006083 [Acer negundo]